jgi:hypothetical protein
MYIQRDDKYIFSDEDAEKIRREAYNKWGHGGQKTLAKVLGLSYIDMQKRFSPKYKTYFRKMHVDRMISVGVWK